MTQESVLLAKYSRSFIPHSASIRWNLTDTTCVSQTLSSGRYRLLQAAHSIKVKSCESFYLYSVISLPKRENRPICFSTREHFVEYQKLQRCPITARSKNMSRKTRSTSCSRNQRIIHLFHWVILNKNIFLDSTTILSDLRLSWVMQFCLETRYISDEVYLLLRYDPYTIW